MSITFDGHRSMLRLHRAKRVLSVCRDLGLPAMAKEEEGFKFRVTNLDPDLDIGRVTAPEGVMVLRSIAGKTEVTTADYWAGGFKPARTLWLPDEVAGLPSGIYGTQLGTAAAVSPSEYAPPWPAAVLPSSFLDEMCAITTVGRYGQSDLAGTFQNFYIDAGRADKTTFASAFGVSNPRVVATCCASAIASDAGMSLFVSTMASNATAMYETESPYRYVVGALLAHGQPGVGSAFLYMGNYFGSFPESVRDAFTYYTGSNHPHTIRVYGYSLRGDLFNNSPTTVHLIRADHMTFPPADDSLEYDLMLVVVNWQTGAGVIHGTSFLASFTGQSAIEAIGAELLKYFAYPCGIQTAWTARDSAMIAADDNTVYCWTRDDDVVKFTTTGISKGVAGFSVPTLVSSTPGVRPNITKSNSSWYFCIAEDTDNNDVVLGIYRGTPFAGWNPLPMPVDTLLHVRPIVNDDVRIMALGILDDGTDRFLGLLDYDVANTPADWKKLGKLPFDGTQPARWGVSAFGSGPTSMLQQEYMQPPHLYPGDLW